MKKQIVNLLIEYDEEKVIVHLEADKERFKKLLEPILLMGIQRLGANSSAKETADQKEKEDLKTLKNPLV